MSALKYTLVSLSLTAALAVPAVALATNNSHNDDHNNQSSHQNDNKNHKDNDHKDKDDHKKSSHNKHYDEDKFCDRDDEGGQGEGEPTPTPTPEAIPEPEASDDNGVVLDSSVTPAAEVAPTTLPVTGAGDGLVFVIAGGSALGAYLLTKRRSLV
jgi:hypothetical protein